MTITLANMGAFVTAYAESDFLGKLIILGLISLSILCWVVLVQKIWLTRQVEQVSKAFHKAYYLNKDRLLHLELEELPKPKNRMVIHPYAEIFRELKSKTVEILNKNNYFSKKEGSHSFLSSSDLEIVETHVLTTISAQTKKLEKNLFILSTIITLGPFLGLLGTVWGILVTFSELHTGGTAGSNTAVLGGLSTALSTTVLGLVIAIPALISYNYLKNAVKTYSSDMEDFLYELLSSVELQYRKADVS
ncbi:MAG: MotA/TolQ/ExbB proton channel family protein [Candidatus Melainabacteria bacterium]|nr:MotA/TolQ/ExbB proton channel family protein [Candidatus Melainabacteria bacterium]